MGLVLIIIMATLKSEKRWRLEAVQMMPSVVRIGLEEISCSLLNSKDYVWDPRLCPDCAQYQTLHKCSHDLM